jgi:hypothetical protein
VDHNPFGVLTLIAAPAILTNASSVLALSTSNRFARAIDRVRLLAAELERTTLPKDDPMVVMKMGQIGRLEQRCLLLLKAMRFFYLGLGCFASGTIVSLFGAAGASAGKAVAVVAAEIIASGAALVGVSGLVAGSACLVRDTRLAVMNVTEETRLLRARLQQR